jgi:single-stranded DNA-binding protein
MTSQVFLSGKLVSTKMSETSRGRPMLTALIECETWRPRSRSEMVMEIGQIPVLAFNFHAETLQKLRSGTPISIVGHLVGTKFEEPGRETKHGLKLVVDEVTFPPAFRPAQPVRELNS